jgi:threonine/homoserine/homoserine lactone efflux protein
MQIIRHGIELGIVLAFLIGPVFFAIIQTSLEKGFSKGVLVCLGVSLSDILYVAIGYFGLAQLLQQPEARKYLALIGGVVLIGFGVYHLAVKSRRKFVLTETVAPRGHLRFIAKGFVINGLSPMVLLFWLATISAASVNYGYTTHREYLVFFIALLGTVFVTDILKAYLAGRLRKLIQPRALAFIHIIVGIALVIFGLRLLFMGIGFR